MLYGELRGADKAVLINAGTARAALASFRNSHSRILLSSKNAQS